VDVEVTLLPVDTGRAMPPEEDVAAGLHQALSLHHPLPF
jgi:hypothetical protein